VDKGDVPDKDLDEHIRMWKESKDPASDIHEILVQYYNDGVINIFFKKIEDKKEIVGAELLKKIVKRYSTFDINDKKRFSYF
jgi:predicted secreted protein